MSLRNDEKPFLDKIEHIGCQVPGGKEQTLIQAKTTLTSANFESETPTTAFYAYLLCSDFTLHCNIRLGQID